MALTRKLTESIRASSASGIDRGKLDFTTLYLETLFDRAFLSFIAANQSQWWAYVADWFAASVQAREEVFWKSRTPDAKAPPAFFPLPTLVPSLVDELLWRCASLLNRLYTQVPFSEAHNAGLELPLIEVPLHRHLLRLGASTLPSPLVTATASTVQWDARFRGLVDAIHADFVLWRTQRARPQLAVSSLLEASGSHICALQARYDRTLVTSEDDWRAAVREVTDKGPSCGPAFLASLETTDLDQLNDALVHLLSGLPVCRTHGLLLHSRGLREDLLEAVLLNQLDGTPPSVDLILEYLCSSERRAKIEERISSEIMASLEPTTFEVVLPVSGSLGGDLTTSVFGLVLRVDFPVADFKPHEGGYVYAHFTEVQARDGEEAVRLCRRKLMVLLSAISVFSTPTEFEIVNAYYRRAGEPGWGASLRRAGVPIGPHSVTDWPLLDGFKFLLTAEDELARRIQEALIRLHRARTTLDEEQQLDESWQALEIIAGKAGSSGASLLCYLPLYFSPDNFGQLNRLEREQAIEVKYTRLLSAFEAVRTARNKGIAHRELVRLDWRVLENHAEWVKRFVKEVVIGAMLGWDGGARTLRELRTVLEKAYLKQYGFRFPRDIQIKARS